MVEIIAGEKGKGKTKWKYRISGQEPETHVRVEQQGSPHQCKRLSD